MSGAAIEYLAPEEGERKVRGPGQPGKSYKVQTGARTMMQGGHMKPQEVDPDVNLRKHVRPVEVRGRWMHGQRMHGQRMHGQWMCGQWMHGVMCGLCGVRCGHAGPRRCLEV